MSVLPIAIAFGGALVAFAAALPWLVRESRRPLVVHAEPVARDPEHPVLSSLVICARSVLVSILPRHTTPDVTDAAELWRTSFAHGRRCAAHPRSEAFAPAVVVASTAEAGERTRVRPPNRAQRARVKSRARPAAAPLQRVGGRSSR
jgi:hypothetical protein